MKKVFMITMALVMAVGFTSCTQDDVVANEQTTFNFIVADKPSLEGDSRATTFKSAWAVGDQIMVMFHNNGWKITENQQLILKYTSTGWTVVNTPDATGWDNETGKFYAVHYRLLNSEENIGIGLKGTECKYLNYLGGEFLEMEGDYSRNGSTINLGTLTLKYNANICFITIPGLGNEKDSWKLYIAKDGIDYTTSGTIRYNQVSQDIPLGGWFDGSNYYSQIYFDYSTGGVINTYGQSGLYAKGVQNGDDLTFAFVPYTNTNTKYNFFLQKGTTGNYVYQVEKTEEKTLKGGNAYLLPATSSWTSTNKHFE